MYSSLVPLRLAREHYDWSKNYTENLLGQSFPTVKLFDSYEPESQIYVDFCHEKGDRFKQRKDFQGKELGIPKQEASG